LDRQHNDEVSVCVAWHTTGIATLEQVMQKELTVGGTGPAADTDQFQGSHATITPSSRSSPAIPVAMTRLGHGAREVMGAALVMVERDRNPQTLFDEKKINVLVQLSLNKHGDLPNVPLIMDFAKTGEDGRSSSWCLPVSRWTPFLAPPHCCGPDGRSAQGVHGYHERTRGSSLKPKK